jgi:hypothetical protein
MYAYIYSVCLMVFKATFNNISLISLRSVLLVEETGGSGESHRPAANHWQTLSHNVVHSAGFTYRLDMFQILGGLRPRCIIYLTLLLMDFHTYVVIMYTALSKQRFSNFPYKVVLNFRIWQNIKHPSSSLPLLNLIKHTSIFLQSWRWGIGRGLTSGIA